MSTLHSIGSGAQGTTGGAEDERARWRARLQRALKELQGTLPADLSHPRHDNGPATQRSP